MPGRRGRGAGRPQTLAQVLAGFLDKTLLPDLKARAELPAVAAALQAHHQEERAAHRTAAHYEGFVADLLTQIGAAWILSCVFLRVLEYFNGLLFLTTNRVDDIDEAIVSRCIALIRFYPPDRVDRKKIWGVMAAQFGLDLAPELHERLPDICPQASGRDIKGLAKLVAKYSSQKQLPPTEDVFRRCSMFRALDQAEVG